MYKFLEAIDIFGIFNPVVILSIIWIFTNLSVAYLTTYFANVITPYFLPSAPFTILILAVVVILSLLNLIFTPTVSLYFFTSFLVNGTTILHSSSVIDL